MCNGAMTTNQRPVAQKQISWSLATAKDMGFLKPTYHAQKRKYQKHQEQSQTQPVDGS